MWPEEGKTGRGQPADRITLYWKSKHFPNVPGSADFIRVLMSS